MTKTNKNIVVEVTQLMNNAATENDLRAINAWIIMRLKQERNLKVAVLKNDLKVGMLVSWVGRKGRGEGRIIKINRTRAQVAVGFTTWNIPISMLNIAE